jgi:hypothetical protein
VPLKLLNLGVFKRGLLYRVLEGQYPYEGGLGGKMNIWMQGEGVRLIESPTAGGLRDRGL